MPYQISKRARLIFKLHILLEAGWREAKPLEATILCFYYIMYVHFIFHSAKMASITNSILTLKII